MTSPKVPAKQFWSVTAYDNESRCFTYFRLYAPTESFGTPTPNPPAGG